MRWLLIAILLAAPASAEEICWHQPFVEDQEVVTYQAQISGLEVPIDAIPGGFLEQDGVMGTKWCAETTTEGTYEWDVAAIWSGGTIWSTNGPKTRYRSPASRADFNGNGAVDMGDVSETFSLLGMSY